MTTGNPDSPSFPVHNSLPYGEPDCAPGTHHPTEPAFDDDWAPLVLGDPDISLEEFMRDYHKVYRDGTRDVTIGDWMAIEMELPGAPAPFDDGIESLSYDGLTGVATINYENGDAIRLNMEAAISAIRTEMSTVYFGRREEPPQQLQIEKSSGRLAPDKITQQSAPAVRQMLIQAYNIEKWQQETLAAGVEIYEDLLWLVGSEIGPAIAAIEGSTVMISRLGASTAERRALVSSAQSNATRGVGNKYPGGRSVVRGTEQLMLNLETRTVFSGHGVWYKAKDGFFIMPQGTTLTVYVKKGEKMGEFLGQAIELNVDLGAIYQKTYKPGMKVPNLTLEPRGKLTVMGNPVTVPTDTLLKDLIRPNQGACHWAACFGIKK